MDLDSCLDRGLTWFDRSNPGRIDPECTCHLSTLILKEHAATLESPATATAKMITDILTMSKHSMKSAKSSRSLNIL